MLDTVSYEGINPDRADHRSMLPFEPSVANPDRYKSSQERRFHKHGSQYKVVSLIGFGKTVLDVGCATGYVDAILRSHDCFVVGIESDFDAATLASKRCDQVLNLDVEAVDSLPLPPEHFDVIVCADVLEHFRRPDRVLLMLKRYLKREGCLITVIPNIGYLPARLKILAGRFDYEDIGHFDRTHLRFFTLRTAKELVTSCGFRLVEVDYVGPASILPVFPTWTAMRILTVARPQQ